MRNGGDSRYFKQPASRVVCLPMYALPRVPALLDPGIHPRRRGDRSRENYVCAVDAARGGGKLGLGPR